MKGNGWKTALPVFLLSATLSTAVLAAGGLGVGVLGRAFPGIVPAPYVSPFAVVDGVAVTLPGQADSAVEDALLAMNRIPQPAPRSADTPPRPRAVAIAGETVPVDVPKAAPRVRSPRQGRPAVPERAPERAGHDDDDDRDGGRPDAAPAPAPQDDTKDKGEADQGNGNAGHGNGRPGNGNGAAANPHGAPEQANGNPGEAEGTPRHPDADNGEPNPRPGRDDAGDDRGDDAGDDGGERRVHTASADGNGRSGGDTDGGTRDRNRRSAR
jgi:hypothetical protein